MTKKPNGLRNVKDNLIEEGNFEVIESRGIDSGHEDFQVLAETSETQNSVRAGSTERVSGGRGRFLRLG